ncbi:MAG: DUF2723 domain-containing protein [Chloroflexi bacterium]|nr:DUF2723 domain-containing protein [Chloroflexota bacterium]
MRLKTAGFLLIPAALLPIYLGTLQTIPNGAEHYLMIDVGETQIVLNTWGTLHATGYPLYVMLGSALVSLQRAFGISPAAAPSVVSLVWMAAALAVIFILMSHLISRTSQAAGSRPFWLAAAAVLLFGLTRTAWIHAVIAEIYSFGLLFLAVLLALALWKPAHGGATIRGRIYRLALVGGFGVCHHRAILVAAPALLVAVWPELTSSPRRLFKRLTLCLLIGLVGFLPYVYLPLRALAGADWVYGQPGTWAGFWDQFFGREAARFIGPPGSFDALLTNVSRVSGALLADLTAPGVIAGSAGLLLALRDPRRQRAAATLLLFGLLPYLFHILFYTDILSALVLPVTLSAAFGWLFLADAALFFFSRRASPPLAAGLIALAAAAFAAALFVANRPFIHDQTADRTGLETIALAESAPPGSALMLAWGPRYFAAGFAQSVLGQLEGVRLVDHRADYAAILKQGQMLVTPAYTFYNQPVSWWQAHLGASVYLRAVEPLLVQISTQPELAESPPTSAPSAAARHLECRVDAIILRVDWTAGEKPTRDLSVFVHLLDAAGGILAQDDQAAPVYGWRPLTTWTAGEIVWDVYTLPRRNEAARVRFGLYYQAESGEFINEVAYELPVDCP